VKPFWYLRRGRGRIHSEIDEELRTHLEMRTEALIAGGMTPEDARREAVRQFGDLPGTLEYCCQQDIHKDDTVQRRLLIQDLFQDLRVGVRGLLRAPTMTLIIITTVGLGIGATTTIFAAIDAALLRPLPYRDPAQLVRIYNDSPPNKFPFSVADYLALDAQQTAFARVAAYGNRQMTFTDGSLADRIQGKLVTWTYFSTLGVRPTIGRDFDEAEGKPGGPPAVIVSRAFWRERLGARFDAIGKPVRLDAVDYTLVGVLPESVGPLERDRQFFVAARFDPPRRRGPFFLVPIARLKGSPAAASEDLRAINQRVVAAWGFQDAKAMFRLGDLETFVVGDVKTIAGVAIAAVSLVWLIACANASSLLIARVTSRRRELVVRAALGASRGRVVRHLLAESLVLALGAAAIGIPLAYAGIALLRDFGAAYFPRTAEIAVNGPMRWLLAALTLGSAGLFGLVPAVHGSGVHAGRVDQALRASSRSSTGSIGVRRLRRVLVASQFAIATPLLVIAGLLLASLSRLARVDLGFDSRNVISGSLVLPAAQYSANRAVSFWDDLQRRVQALPGITAVAFADGRPPNGVSNLNDFELEDAPTPPGGAPPVVPWIAVSPEYFQLLGLQLHEGRVFDARDLQAATDNTAESPIVVDRAWARRFFPNRSAVGRRLKSGGCRQCSWTVVVGVVNEVKYAGLDKPDEGTVYDLLNPQANSKYLLVRTAVEPSTIVAQLRDAVRRLDAGIPLSNVATIDELVDTALARPRSLSVLVAALAAVALALSMIGIYGVMAYHVQQHAKDIAIRLALGSSRGDLFRLVVGQGMIVVLGGVVIGLLVSFAVTHVIANLLFGVTAADPRTFVAVTGVLAAVALAACALPAGRAIRVEAASVLRDE
jgi:putative ABC transport system permease protein